MPTVNQIRDSEITRQKRNLTDAQKRNAELTREGVVINELVKAPKRFDMSDLYNSMIISDSVKMPDKISENKMTSQQKSILPISLTTTGVMATLALISLVVKKSAKANLNLEAAKKLPYMTRNHAMNEETHQAIYQMVQCPNQKTILAGAGVIIISAMGFMGKMFLDGFKEVWVKKREADIQKNLQENLIEVETQSFSGKIQIIRSMLAQKAKELGSYICYEPSSHPTFKSFKDNLNFSGNKNPQNKKSDDNNLKYFALGVLTLGAIVGFGFLSLKNLGKSRKYLEKYAEDTKQKISEIVLKSTFQTKEIDGENLKNMLQAIDASPSYIQKELSKLNWGDEAKKTEFIEEVSFNVRKSTAQADRAFGGDGTPKPTFYSHVNDYRAFFYDYLLNTSNPLFKSLFLGITGITAISYGGKILGEAVKEVQVKKMNAETELDLQQRLVSTELRNFKAKKDTAINPLLEEFHTQVQRGKSKEELKTMAENILFEVKNGPPFVYS